MTKPLAVACLVFSLSLSALGEEVPEYRVIRDARPDGRTVSVVNLEIARDVHHFQLRKGTIHFLTPASDGRTVGAVFIGEGTYELRPSSESERRRLRLATRDENLEVLADSFDRLVLLFTDATDQEIQKKGTADSAAPSPEATRIYEDYLKLQKTKLRLNLHLRLLRDVLGGTAAKDGVFLAVMDGRKLDPALIALDPSGIGNLAAGLTFFGGEESAFLSLDDENGGFWYLAARGSSASVERGKPLQLLADALHYSIDMTIAANVSIDGTTIVTLRPLVEGVRVLPLHILPKLRLREASYTIDGGTSVDAGIVQEEIELGRFRKLFQDEVADADAALVFPSPLPAGKTVGLRISYEGRDVLRGVGNDSYSVRARESWYPNIGTFSDPATYELTFRFPKRSNLIATGVLAREETNGDQKVSVWKSSGAMRIAGFNFGRFEKISRTDEQSGAAIDVYTHRDFRKHAGDTMVDAINAARVGTAFFGKSQFSPVAVTQQVEWNFGQSWPSLIYLPTLALTTSTDRAFMLEGVNPLAVWGVQEFAKMVGWHEYAHQWWGHQVGWQSYRDQWLSEGFAEFTSALVLQLTESTGKYNDYWELRRKEIFRKSFGIAYADAGPISDGVRLSTKTMPGAYSTIVYSKGAWVLHMIRCMMRDPAKANPDERFIAMMRDFVLTWSGKSPSTADFQRTVEKYITPAMNATGNGSMSYFFDQWVYGMEIPRLSSNISVTRTAEGKYRMKGTITQSGVSENFATVVPIYVDFGKDDIGRLGQMVVGGSSAVPVDFEVSLPKEPRRVFVNAMRDVLTRD